jgi:hypothetical protein
MRECRFLCRLFPKWVLSQYKEAIYQSIAYHALQIVNFFPEVHHFDYIVLWDDYSKQEVLTLAIDEDAIKRLADI